ncbi:hypothetical protein CPAR01_12400 [Colletotrichum paranaense]|uniref:Velvet domain-containing protein n=5 Tax=Colletotrichum acutatum species complex TaxID=2707335 RepID=A0A9P9XK01_9PEZI|nr:uncharacterized protein CCOS01_10454 [Colletotrichum costaricense]XP_060344189.1 uncharacterized protein CPAR01_12400 [Colletotrichum paranaense]XP_060378540.1 uncharacterized protein CTAM01_10738 [Colletotrichum tamarilloi]XP_060403636.1 uncharacterized protein CABS01_06586 [Colletotrichum abscissum]KAK1463155.1 hypothetical protein CMEL01_13224 [Colletotrichum melonis]KAI3554622.1 hypothetical protein CABS02_05103 [Colletotrichum abscissum]KAK1490265.1 hypothetical protein CTAM01_10738 [
MSYQSSWHTGPAPDPQDIMRDRDSLRLVIVQAPQHAKIATGKEKDRKPIDPPPILKIDLRSHNQNYANFILSSPSLFVQVYLKPGDKKTKMDPETCAKGLVGSTVSSLQKYKSIDGQDEGYFVFPDLSVKMEGFFKLRFALYNMKGGEVYFMTEMESHGFQVHTARSYPGMSSSTDLTRHLSDQGCRLRIRKDSQVVKNRKRQFQYGMDSEQMRSVRQRQGMAQLAQQAQRSKDLAQQQGFSHQGSATGVPSPASSSHGSAQASAGTIMQQTSRHQVQAVSYAHPQPLMAHSMPGIMGMQLPHSSVYPPPTPSSGLSVASLPSTSPTQSPDLVTPSYYRLDAGLYDYTATQNSLGDTFFPQSHQPYKTEQYWERDPDSRINSHGHGHGHS